MQQLETQEMQMQTGPMPFTPADVRRALGSRGEGKGVEVTACCVLLDLGSGEYEAYAVVDRGGGREVTVRGGAAQAVFLLPPHAPLSGPLLECRPGDVLDGMAGSAFCYQVVSRDGSPLLTEAERERHRSARRAARDGEWANTPP